MMLALNDDWSCPEDGSLEVAVDRAIPYDLTDILGFDAFRSLERDAISLSMPRWREFPTGQDAVLLPSERHFFKLFLRLSRWHPHGRFIVDLRGDNLRVEVLEGASDTALNTAGDSPLGRKELSVRLTLDRRPLPWANGVTGDPIWPSFTVGISGLGIVRGARVSCQVSPDPPHPPLPPPSPSPPLEPPLTWLRPRPPPQPPPSPRPVKATQLDDALVAPALVASAGVILFSLLCACRLHRKRTERARTRAAAGRKPSPSKSAMAKGSRRKKGRERVPTQEVDEPASDIESSISTLASTMENVEPWWIGKEEDI